MASAYQLFAGEALRQGKTMEEIGDAWREAHDAPRGKNPYTPEGSHWHTRSQRLVEGLRRWPGDFKRALAFAERETNPGKAKRARRAAYAHEYRQGYRSDRAAVRDERARARAGDENAVAEGAFGRRAAREARRLNPTVPGLRFARQHWLPLSATAAVGATLLYARSVFSRRPKPPAEPNDTDITIAGAPANAANSVNAYTPPSHGSQGGGRLVTAADAVQTDRGIYDGLPALRPTGRYRP